MAPANEAENWGPTAAGAGAGSRSTTTAGSAGVATTGSFGTERRNIKAPDHLQARLRGSPALYAGDPR
ncbi:hypothetical protein GCM10010492_06680 [Saccharothrix mutabilis subsp. mutabilis]|uniref:Uncharacterized protein n=1 Tax=Saccharothrix mutabilis subsp. mutabilis TaxID=66855 RepID=A0ABN0T3M8_9PSEU